MDDSPWGAPDDSFASSLPRPRSPPLNFSATSSLPLPTAPTWADDDGPGWGASADDSPGAVLPTRSAGLPSLDTLDVPKVEEDISGGTGFAGTSGSWDNESPELPRLATLSPPLDTAADDSTADLPPLPPLSSPSAVFASPSRPSEDAIGSANEEQDDGGGWGGASPDLPPIASLRVASPPSPEPEERDSGWGVETEDADPSDIPPPLPTVDEVFASAKRRRESVELAKQAEAGEDAWGSSQGWEERLRIEAEAREKERLAELAAAGIEPTPEKPADNAETSKQDGAENPERPAANGGITSMFRSFRKGAEDAAAKSTEVVKDASNSAARGVAAIGRTASARSSQDEGRGESPARTSEERAAGKSWWSRSGAKKEEAKKPEPKEEDDPNTIGVEEVQQGESGRVDSPEPQQGAIGRFLSRLKRPASAPTEGSSDARQTPSPRNSSEQQPPAFRADDFDALANGEIGRVTLQVRQKHEEEDATPRGGLFGLRSKSAAAVPSAPPEDDFGGLIGALADAPVRPSARSGISKTFDPFDPLSDSFGALPAPSAPHRATHAAAPPLQPPPSQTAIPPSRPAVQPPTHNRRTSSVASFPASPPLAPATSANEPEDSFDDFFNSVVASTSKPVSPPAVKVVAPTPRQNKPASTLLPSAPTQPIRTTSTKSPPPRMTISPPVRTSTASPASASGASRATTPIMPLAPPPPPSQPLASTRGHVLPPPPAVTQRVGTPLQAAPLAPSPASSAGAKSPSPAPPQRSTSGPLSLDDLSFFES
ncbi:hypothetical protein NBRC10512_007937 [Rhodotorula toruloides]|uniref:RHTO0S04e03488g1_1 n=2 Tax=Rhodotorula toruloides TaxID=5286 RepID=A0A061AQ38_RHOTO|nr:uncharacterized protein RHTO_02515 [Rhodotorula toruloides NP11]EMS20567.1 hypothetical protein RHTO_02515 [Rhodotorula toruloides NP11]CDR39276.1 RHTO0S04e03488g1_1 [Rhodotorula toruloides]